MDTKSELHDLIGEFAPKVRDLKELLSRLEDAVFQQEDGSKDEMIQYLRDQNSDLAIRLANSSRATRDLADQIVVLKFQLEYGL